MFPTHSFNPILLSKIALAQANITLTLSSSKSFVLPPPLSDKQATDATSSAAQRSTLHAQTIDVLETSTSLSSAGGTTTHI
ncbi:hypothetical protein PM082_008487 [Marasmius tenuissimus]|nr:hypothetical protein PM082_008487 [Marasmius tenuissimus]